MDEFVQWLTAADGTVWAPLGDAMRRGLPVPNGYLVSPSTSEEHIRAAYEELKIREKTHFLAVRGASHAVLNEIGPDTLVHTVRRLRMEAPEVVILVQRMVHSQWCGKTQWSGTELQIKANEGLLLLDPDTYTVDTQTGKCLHRMLETKQRKMIRRVDGTAKVVEREGERTAMPEELVSQVAELAVRTAANIGWAIDDLEKVWLLSVGSTETADYAPLPST